MHHSKLEKSIEIETLTVELVNQGYELDFDRLEMTVFPWSEVRGIQIRLSLVWWPFLVQNRSTLCYLLECKEDSDELQHRAA
jgi:hypothetical protein